MAEAFLQKSFDCIDLSDATARPSDILAGATAYLASGKVSGIMTNRGAVSSNLNAGASYTIPAGYHNGAGVVRANSLASQTSANATASDILSGKTAWVNGTRLTGTATAGSQVAYGTITAKKTPFSFTPGFKARQFVIFMYDTYSSGSGYYYGTMRLLSCFYNGSTLLEFGLTSHASSAFYYNGGSGGSVSITSTSVTVDPDVYGIYTNGPPLMWVAWS